MSESPKVVVTESTANPVDTVARTPAGMADLCVVVMRPLSIVLVRALRTGIQAFLAALGLGALGPMLVGVSDVLPPGSLGEKLLAALYVGALAALLTALQNAVELLAEWDTTHPKLRA